MKSKYSIKELFDAEGFFYTQPELDQEYNANPSNPLDPEQIGKGDTNWFYAQRINDNKPADDDDKMTVVITDPTHHYFQPSEEYKDLENIFWRYLFNLGFDVYIWKQGPVKTASHADLLKHLPEIIPESKTRVKRMAKISSPDRTLVLDYSDVRRLLTKLKTACDISWAEDIKTDEYQVKDFDNATLNDLEKAMPGINSAGFNLLTFSPDKKMNLLMNN